MSPFEELLAKLARAEVRFVVVGGGAVLMQGHARSTQDLDILIEASEENARRLIGALTTWGEGAGAELSVEELSTPQTGAVRVIEDFPVDVFTSMRARTLRRDLTYEHLAVDALTHTLPNGSKVLYASIPRLLDLKAGTGRSKDQIDSQNLVEIDRGLRQKTPADLTPSELGPTTDSSSDQGDWPLPPTKNHE